MKNSKNPPINWKRFIIGFLLAPLGVQIPFFVIGLLGCSIDQTLQSCKEGIFDLGIASSIFVFPSVWILQLVIGVPLIFTLRYFGILKAWTLIIASAIAGALVYIPIAQYSQQYAQQMNTYNGPWLYVYGATFAACIAMVMWKYAFKPKNKDKRDLLQSPAQALT